MAKNQKSFSSLKSACVEGYPLHSEPVTECDTIVDLAELVRSMMMCSGHDEWDVEVDTTWQLTEGLFKKTFYPMFVIRNKGEYSWDELYVALIPDGGKKYAMLFRTPGRCTKNMASLEKDYNKTTEKIENEPPINAALDRALLAGMKAKYNKEAEKAEKQEEFCQCLIGILAELY